MATANMSCKKCGNEWEYSGMDKTSAYCPTCNTENDLQRHGSDVQVRGVSMDTHLAERGN